MKHSGSLQYFLTLKKLHQAGEVVVIAEVNFQFAFAVRVCGKFDLQIEYILKLTLQPLVENALYHGIKNKRGKGKITVRGYEKEDHIYLEVADNGIGMDEEELEQLQKKLKGETPHERGFGLGNVNERI
ncbi:MAG: sensor histidine kinase, partial [Thermoguttaceae bacterium]